MARSDADDHLEPFALKWASRLMGFPSPARRAVLWVLAVGNPAGAAIVRELVFGRTVSDSILDRPLQSALGSAGNEGQEDARVDAGKRIGSRLGAWRVVSLLGMGGMGVVYLARRDDGSYQRDVALKCMQGKLTSEEAISAFQTERNALAKLNHRDIVPIIDGGIHDDGTAWFAMPLLEGDRIDEWCDQRSLDVRRRVKLLIDVCEALSHAHERAVLHLDIKPSAILVDVEGHPKLLDFGVAEISDAGRVASEGSSSRLAAFSPGFSAPELMAAGRGSAASDVYSVGALMYVLLCGQPPVSANALQAQIAIASRSAAAPPSAMASRCAPSVHAARSCGTARQLGKQLEGDLDAIAMRCVAFEPDARYRSMLALRDDLACWSAGKPISLRKTFGYAAARFVARNSRLVSLAILFALVTLTLGAVLAWQHHEAVREVEISTRAEQIFSQSLASAALRQAGAPVGSAAFLGRTEVNFRRYADKDPPAVLARGLSALARSQTEAGNYDAAHRLAAESATLASGEGLQFAFNQVTLARLYNLRAQHAAAITAVEVGRKRLGFVFTDQEKLARLQLDTQLAVAHYGAGAAAKALRILGDSIPECEALDTSASRLALAQMLILRGSWYRQRLLVEASERDLARAMSLASTTDPRIMDDAREVLVRTIRSSSSEGREKRALKVATDLLASRSSTLGAQHPQTGIAWVELASMQMLAQDNARAQESVGRAERILASTLGKHHPAYAKVLVAQSHLRIFQSKLGEAVALTEAARGILARHHGEAHELTLDVRFLLANEYWWMARQDAGYMDKAMKEMRETIAIYQHRNGEVPALHRMAFADMLHQAGENESAEREIAQAERDAVRQYGPQSEEVLSAQHSRWEMATERTGFTAERSSALDALIDGAARIDSLYARSILFTLLLSKAEWHAKAGNSDEARSAVMEAERLAGEVKIPAWLDKARQVAGEIAVPQGEPSPVGH